MTEIGIMTEYDVRGFHDMFRDQFPNFAVATGLENLNPLPSEGAINQTTANLIIGEPPRRFWFTSADGAFVLQAQENMLALNWRRRGFKPNTPSDYPGFEAMLGMFRGIYDKVRDARDGQHPMPNPASCELLYDNMLSLRDGHGNQLRLEQALREIRPGDSQIGKLGWRMAWHELFEDAPDPKSTSFSVQISTGGALVADTSDICPVARIEFSSRSLVKGWDDVFSFFEKARFRTHARLEALTTKEVRASW